MQAAGEELNVGPSAERRRWRPVVVESAVVLLLVYFTLMGGTIEGTYQFPLVLVSHLLAMTVLIGWAVGICLHKRWVPRTPLDLPLLVFFVLNVLSTMFSSERRLSLENLVYLSIFILSYYVVVGFLTDGWAVSYLVRPMLLVGGIVVALALVELMLWMATFYVQTGKPWLLLSLNQYRWRILLGPANVLAWYVVLLLPLALAQLLSARSRGVKVALGALAFGAIILFGSTLSRSGLLGMAVGLSAFIILLIARRLRWTEVLLRTKRWLVLVTGSAATLLAVAILITLSLNLAQFRAYTISVRLELWRAAAHMIAEKSLLGAGLGTFGYLFHQVPDYDFSLPDIFYNNAHNGYINIAAETGVPSLLAGLWLMAALVVNGLKGRRGSDGRWGYQGLISHACLAGVLGLSTATLFDVPWVFPLITLYTVLFAAIIMAPRSEARLVSSSIARWMILAAVLILALALVWIDSAHYFQEQAIEAMSDDDLATAVRDLERSVAIDPFMAVYRFQLGIAQGRLSLATGDTRMLQQAIGAFEAEISRGGDTAINNANLAWLNWKAADAVEALSCMERAATLAPREAKYKLGLGYLLEQTGSEEAAREAYTAAVTLDPDLVDSGFWQGSLHRRNFRATLLEGEQPPTLALARAAYWTQDYDYAIRILADLPQSASTYVLRGQIDTERGEHDGALEHLNSALELNETDPAAYLARGELYLQLGKQSEAARDLMIASALGLSRADIVLGEIEYQAQDLDAAIQAYERGLPRCGTSASAYYYASHVYHRADVVPNFWPDYVICAPSDSLVPGYLHLASAYRQTGASRKADELCQWLEGSYETSDLRQLEEGDGGQLACPEGAAEN
jgi:tetratricopeptide (TPR) repeat protein/O-antigen ligase